MGLFKLFRKLSKEDIEYKNEYVLNKTWMDAKELILNLNLKFKDRPYKFIFSFKKLSYDNPEEVDKYNYNRCIVMKVFAPISSQEEYSECFEFTEMDIRRNLQYIVYFIETVFVYKYFHRLLIEEYDKVGYKVLSILPLINNLPSESYYNFLKH